jgi:hypothetical protein
VIDFEKDECRLLQRLAVDLHQKLAVDLHQKLAVDLHQKLAVDLHQKLAVDLHQKHWPQECRHTTDCQGLIRNSN